MKIFFILFLTSFISFTSFSQSIAGFNYSKVDSYVKSLHGKKFNAVGKLSKTLTGNFQTPQERVRSIFDWMALNVAYNIKEDATDPEKVLRKREAICAGYSSLFKALCDSAHIRCEIISGYAKREIRDIGIVKLPTNHAWNAVQLQGKWYLVDATWGAGYFRPGGEDFIPEYDEFFFLTPPDEFIYSHYPNDSSWQLLDSVVSKNVFSSAPIFYSSLFMDSFQWRSPSKGNIKMKTGDSLEFKFVSTQAPHLLYSFQNSKYSTTPDLKKEGNTYSFIIHCKVRGTGELTVFNNEQAIAGFRIVIQ